MSFQLQLASDYTCHTFCFSFVCSLFPHLTFLLNLIIIFCIIFVFYATCANYNWLRLRSWCIEGCYLGKLHVSLCQVKTSQKDW